ncbi:MAG: carbohydrate-binding family 9-like protein [Bryobacteraceae bacterium]
MKTLTGMMLAAAGMAMAADNAGMLIPAPQAKKDFALTADPSSAAWRNVPVVKAAVDPFGKPATAGNAFDFRVQWTPANLYFLFECPYETLTLKPQPDTRNETNKLWEWDVTEIFIGADFDNIHRYLELQVSPQGEWVDLDIDRKKPLPEGGWKWNSGMTVRARIDQKKRVWYGEMKIPLASIDKRTPAAGNEFRINVYRLTGGPGARTSTMWAPVGNRSHHTPEMFGRMVLTR